MFYWVSCSFIIFFQFYWGITDKYNCKIFKVYPPEQYLNDLCCKELFICNVYYADDNSLFFNIILVSLIGLEEAEERDGGDHGRETSPT